MRLFQRLLQQDNFNQKCKINATGFPDVDVTIALAAKQHCRKDNLAASLRKRAKSFHKPMDMQHETQHVWSFTVALRQQGTNVTSSRNLSSCYASTN